MLYAETMNRQAPLIAHRKTPRHQTRPRDAVALRVKYTNTQPVCIFLICMRGFPHDNPHLSPHFILGIKRSVWKSNKIVRQECTEPWVFLNRELDLGELCLDREMNPRLFVT